MVDTVVKIFFKEQAAVLMIFLNQFLVVEEVGCLIACPGGLPLMNWGTLFTVVVGATFLGI